MKYYLLILFILEFFFAGSQEFNVLTKSLEIGQPVLTKVISIDNQGEDITEILIDQKTHKTYYFFSTSTDSTIKNTFDNLDRQIPRCGIITEEGVKMTIPDYFVDALKVHDGNLIIGSKDVVNNKSSLKKYKIQNRQLVLVKEYQFNSFFHNFEATENYMVVTDQYMEAGARVYIFNTDLEKLKEFMPFPGEAYSETSVKENSGHILNFSTSYQNPGKMHFSLFDKNLNLLKDAYHTNEPLYFQFMHFDKDLIFIGGTKNKTNPQSTLQCYDLNFNLRWEKPYNFPFWHKNVDLINNDNTYWGYISSGTGVNNIYELEKSTGRTIQIINLDSIYNKKYSSSQGVLIAMVFEMSSNNTLEIVLGKCENEEINNNIITKSNETALFTIDSNQNTVQITELPEEFIIPRPVKSTNVGRNLIIHFTQKTFYYEIP